MGNQPSAPTVLPRPSYSHGNLVAANVDLAPLARGKRLALVVAHLDLDSRQRHASGLQAATQPLRLCCRRAARCSSGPSTVMVELVSVRPYALVKSVSGKSSMARSITASRHLAAAVGERLKMRHVGAFLPFERVDDAGRAWSAPRKPS